jgi:uncharacterized surface protein with fasciclin (FAS1) repeats
MMRAMTIAAACLALSACQQQGADGEKADATNKAAPAAGEQAKQSIADGLTASADHRTLVNAVEASGLGDTLSGNQPYTLFAPTDAAFARLPPGAAAGLLAPENKAQLLALLTGHIVPGTVTASDLGSAIDRGKGKASLATVGGGTLSFTRADGGIAVAGPDGSGARIAGAERLQANGVVHSIDAVLAPQ